MVCYFSCVGQVTSVSSGSGVRVAEVLISEGTVGGLGEDRSFQVYFWPGLGTELLANKCYLLRGTAILQETLESEMPRVRSSTVVSQLPLISLLYGSSSNLLRAYGSPLRIGTSLPHSSR